MANLTTVTYSAGALAGTTTGTVSTIDNIVSLVQQTKVTDGTNTATVKAASTAPVATDPALVVAISPNGVNANQTAAYNYSVGAAPVALPQNMPILNILTTQANGGTSSRVVAAATTNATSLKASAGNVYNIDVYNTSAGTVFLKLYNKASAPTVGTDTPVWTIPIAAATGYARSFSYGKPFSTGIAYAITNLQADTDTTAVAANCLTGSIDWI